MFLEPREYIQWHNTHFLRPSCCLGHTLRTYILFCAPTLLLFGAFCVFRNRTHKFMKHGLEPCWIYIRNGWYYRWMFKMHLIQYFAHPFFKSCDFLLVPCIKFSHLFVSFMHTHLHYISQKLFSTKISLSFHLSLVHDKGIFWEGCCLH